MADANNRSAEVEAAAVFAGVQAEATLRPFVSLLLILERRQAAGLKAIRTSQGVQENVRTRLGITEPRAARCDRAHFTARHFIFLCLPSFEYVVDVLSHQERACIVAFVRARACACV
jgi:hypothetical protein